MHTIFDIACNFTNERFDKDLNDVISRSFDNNITKFGLICSQLKDVQRIIEIKDLYPDSIYFTLGVHPHNSNEINEFFDIGFITLILSDNPKGNKFFL